jgi:hypothetical protein
MTKNIFNGLGKIERSILHELADGSTLDANVLAAFVYRPNHGSYHVKPVTAAQYSAVSRALKRLQQAGKVGTIGYTRQGYKQWVTAERLAKLIEKDEITCQLCQQRFQDGHYGYCLDNGDKVHPVCWTNQKVDGQFVNRGESRPPRSFRYIDRYRKLNAARQASDEDDARRR